MVYPYNLQTSNGILRIPPPHFVQHVRQALHDVHAFQVFSGDPYSTI